jgi:hypothetical protein
MAEQRLAYFINESIRDENGELIVCIAKEGERGYYRTDWYYGKDIERAQPLVDDLNRRLGLSADDVIQIQASTMR